MKDSLFSDLPFLNKRKYCLTRVNLSTREGPGFVVDMYQLERLFIELYFPRNQTEFCSSEDLLFSRRC